MKVNLKILFTIIAVCIVNSITYATHIIGGELSYKYFGNNKYIFTLKMYRDCYNGIADFDDPTRLTFYDSDNNLVKFNFNGWIYNFYPLFPVGKKLPLFSPDSCKLAPYDVCVEEAIMISDTIILPYAQKGYTVSYQRCCRNGTILNIEEPGYTGTTYTTHVEMDTTQFKLGNSSPYFKNFPPIFICNQSPFEFDHSAIDPDGDSLVYKLCTPYSGGGPVYPNIYPYPAAPPPYDTIIFKNPYSISNQLGGKEKMKIDSKTGKLTAFTTDIGQFVVGICVDEYRDGKFINTHRRDFQLNTTECLDKPKAELPDYLIECNKNIFTINFKNKSRGAVSYFWAFGDSSNAPNDTSTLKDPSYTYPKLGIYNVMLVTNPQLYCRDTAITQVKIYNTTDGAAFESTNVCEFEPTVLKDKSILTDGFANKWKWIINNNPNDTMIGPNPVVSNRKNGIYNIKLVVFNQNQCTDTATGNLEFYSKPYIIKSADDSICPSSQATIEAMSNGNITWAPSNEVNCINCLQNQVSPNKNTTYFIKSENSNHCISEDSIHINIIRINPPIIDFNFDTVRCAPVSINFKALISYFDSTCSNYQNWIWKINNESINNNQAELSHLFQNGGIYNIDVQLNNSEIISKSAKVYPPDSCYTNLFIPNTFTPNNDRENDIFYIRGTNIRKLDLKIFNRWGEEVFSTSDYHQGWDGTYRGEKMKPQVFFYKANITFWDKSTQYKEGNITLIE